MKRTRIATKLGLLLLALTSMPMSRAAATGIYLQGIGPVNRSMGSAAVAAPIDAIGALHWNPASISGMPRSELSFGLELLLPDSEITSTIPAFGLTGTSDSEAGATPIPSVGWVQHSDKMPGLTYGLGVFGVAGLATNYQSSLTNPVLFPQETPPGSGMPGGFGRISTEAQFMQLTPTLAYAVNDKLSIGFAPTVTLGKVIVNPMVFIPTDDANGDFLETYPTGVGSRWAWGFGGQAGVYYISDSGLRLGASIKSPQWMEDFRYRSQDENGFPRHDRVKIDLPMIVSVGTSYCLLENILLALDVRYYDYKNTDGFGTEGFSPDGALQGLAWKGALEVALGTQIQLSERLYGRVGYQFNQNPIAQNEAFFNLGSPTVVQHWVNFGGSYLVNDCVSVDFAVTHGFENRVTGQFIGSPDPAATVSTAASGWAWTLGVTMRL
jgi:long-chain fatty acid transport protein